MLIVIIISGVILLIIIIISIICICKKCKKCPFYSKGLITPSSQINYTSTEMDVISKEPGLDVKVENKPFKTYNLLNMNNNIQIKGEHIEVIFQTTTQIKNKLIIGLDNSAEEIIKLYLNEIKHPELFGDKDIAFMCNGDKIKINSEEKIKTIVKDINIGSRIVVCDPKFKIKKN